MEALYCIALLLIWLPGISWLIKLLTNVVPLMMSPGPDGLCIFKPTPEGPVSDKFIPESLTTPEIGSVPFDKILVMLVPL